jgi:hypothetical protein
VVGGVRLGLAPGRPRGRPRSVRSLYQGSWLPTLTQGYLATLQALTKDTRTTQHMITPNKSPLLHSQKQCCTREDVESGIHFIVGMYMCGPRITIQNSRYAYNSQSQTVAEDAQNLGRANQKHSYFNP